MVAGISPFERNLISQRTKEGLEAARAKSKVGSRKPKLDAIKKKTMFCTTKPMLYKAMK